MEDFNINNCPNCHWKDTITTRGYHKLNGIINRKCKRCGYEDKYKIISTIQYEKVIEENLLSDSSISANAKGYGPICG